MVVAQPLGVGEQFLKSLVKEGPIRAFFTFSHKKWGVHQRYD